MANFWLGKKVFLTYPATFRGAWLTMYLESLGAQVLGYGPNAPRDPHLFDLANIAQSATTSFGSLQDLENFKQALQYADADVVIHLGPEASFREALSEPAASFTESVVGTANLMEALRETGSVRAVLILSSDKVFAKTGADDLIPESQAVAAGDIGPTAKLCSELVTLSYRQSFFSPDKFNKHKVALAAVRVGSVIGGGDFTPESFIFQAVQAFRNGESLVVKNPQSHRPWLHVLDEAEGLAKICQALYEKGPKAEPLWNLAAVEAAGVGAVARILAEAWGPDAKVNVGESSGGVSRHGMLDMGLVMKELQWQPHWALTEMMRNTVRWYQQFYSENKTARELCMQSLSAMTGELLL